MSVYTVQLDQPNSSLPAVFWNVVVFEEGAKRATLAEGGHVLSVPSLETWIPETLWMVLHEVSAYIPAHRDAECWVRATMSKPRGRQPKDGSTRAPQFSDEVCLGVSARGWYAQVETWLDAREDVKYHPRRFSEPMQAVLLEYAARRFFPLSSVPRVLAGAADERERFKPSRLRIHLGLDAPYDEEKKKFRHKIMRVNRRLRHILDTLDQNAGVR